MQTAGNESDDEILSPLTVRLIIKLALEKDQNQTICVHIAPSNGIVFRVLKISLIMR